MLLKLLVDVLLTQYQLSQIYVALPCKALHYSSCNCSAERRSCRATDVLLTQARVLVIIIAQQLRLYQHVPSISMSDSAHPGSAC